MRSWMVDCVRRMRQKMEPKMMAEEMLVPARATLVARSRVACRHERVSSSLRGGGTGTALGCLAADAPGGQGCKWIATKIFEYGACCVPHRQHCSVAADAAHAACSVMQNILKKRSLSSQHRSHLNWRRQPDGGSVSAEPARLSAAASAAAAASPPPPFSAAACCFCRNASTSCLLRSLLRRYRFSLLQLR